MAVDTSFPPGRVYRGQDGNFHTGTASLIVDAGGTLDYSAGTVTKQAVFTGDVYAATNTIDTTKLVHVIAAANGTAAASTWTPSAIPAAGAEVILITEADASGTVTVTFGTGFKSTGTQATTASHFSAITFVSDGTQLIERARATASS